MHRGTTGRRHVKRVSSRSVVRFLARRGADRVVAGRAGRSERGGRLKQGRPADVDRVVTSHQRNDRSGRSTFSPCVSRGIGDVFRSYQKKSSAIVVTTRFRTRLPTRQSEARPAAPYLLCWVLWSLQSCALYGKWLLPRLRRSTAIGAFGSKSYRSSERSPNRRPIDRTVSRVHRRARLHVTCFSYTTTHHSP